MRNACPGCGLKNIKTIYSSGYLEKPLFDFIKNYYAPHGTIDTDCLKGASYILCECNDCGLIFQKEVPNDFLMSKLYEEWINPKINIENHKNNDTLGHFIDYAHEIMRIIKMMNRIPSSIRVLDYGTGLAKWALMIKAFGCDVYGTEISYGKKRHAQECGIKIVDLNDSKESQFDLINIDQVLEHLREPLKTLQLLNTYLKPDGIIKVGVPNGVNIKAQLRIMDWEAPKQSKRSLHTVHPLEHINCFNRASLITLVNKAGFKLLNVSSFNNFPLVFRKNPFEERHPKHIALIAREEWYSNFRQYPTNLLLKRQ